MDAQLFLKSLFKKYGPSLSLLDRLARSYGSTAPDASGAPDDQNVTASPAARPATAPPLVFTDDPQKNADTLRRIMRGFEELKGNLLDLAGQSLDIYSKLLQKYADKVGKLSGRDKDGEELAGKFQKILEQTLLKLWSGDTQDSPSNACLRAYFADCGIRSKDYPAGHRLSDEDLTYLDTGMTQAYITLTSLPDKDYEVIQMIRPVLFIGYQEDGEEAQDTFVGGICRYFVRKR